MPVDIIVPVFNAGAHLARCMTALRPTTPKGARVIMADDSSSEPQCLEYLQFLENTGIAKVVHSEQRRGFAGINNWAVRNHTTAEMVCLLNQDTVPTGSWLTFMVETMRSDPKCAIVGAKLIFPADKPGMAGKIQHIGVARNADGSPYHPFYGEPADIIQAQIRREVNAVTGACMLVQRTLWEQLKGFNEAFVGGQFEDVDFCWRARKMGYKIIVDPRAVLYHFEHGSGEEHVQRTHDKNRALLLSRWRGIGSDQALWGTQVPLTEV